MAQKQKIVMPGEIITTEEEYAAGLNTYAENGLIKASAIGEAAFDENTKEAFVKARTVEELERGDIVTGKVMLVKESSAVIELLSAENGKRITGVKTAQLPVRNVSTEYITEIKKIIKIGDIIRARVDVASPLGIDLLTNEKGLGVTKAYCSNCRKEMQYSNGKLMCLECGSVEERKWFESEQKPREFAPRSGGFGHDRRGGFGGRGRGFGGGHSGGFGRRDGARGFGRREGGFGGGRGRSGGFGERHGRGFSERRGGFEGENRGSY